jgi:hypothetical protein
MYSPRLGCAFTCASIAGGNFTCTVVMVPLSAGLAIVSALLLVKPGQHGVEIIG